MESKRDKSSILVTIESNEAIVLLEWLSRFNAQEYSALFEDQAEQRVLFDLESELEKVISETFRDDYLEILNMARRNIRD